MLIIPAIDIFNKQCVRLYQGDYDTVQVYDKDPAAVAGRFEQAGARLIHIVDLNAARGGSKKNRQVINKISKRVCCQIEVGGGIRSEEDIEQFLAMGIQRLVLGTVLIRKTDLVAQWILKYGLDFVGGIDARDGQVKVSGWLDKTDVSDVELAKRLKKIGIKEIIYTNISRDGALTGPDIKSTNQLASQAEIDVILSGGVSSEQDIERIFKQKHARVRGVILGRAIYEKKVNLVNLIKQYQK